MSDYEVFSETRFAWAWAKDHNFCPHDLASEIRNLEILCREDGTGKLDDDEFTAALDVLEAFYTIRLALKILGDGDHLRQNPDDDAHLWRYNRAYDLLKDRHLLVELEGEVWIVKDKRPKRFYPQRGYVDYFTFRNVTIMQTHALYADNGNIIGVCSDEVNLRTLLVDISRGIPYEYDGLFTEEAIYNRYLHGDGGKHCNDAMIRNLERWTQQYAWLVPVKGN